MLLFTEDLEVILPGNAGADLICANLDYLTNYGPSKAPKTMCLMNGNYRRKKFGVHCFVPLAKNAIF